MVNRLSVIVSPDLTAYSYYYYYFFFFVFFVGVFVIGIPVFFASSSAAA